MLGRDAHAIAADGGGDGGDGLVLSDDVRFEALVKLAQALKLILTDAACRDLRPQLDHTGKVIHCQRGRFVAEPVKLRLALHDAAAQLGDALIVRIGGVLCGLFLEHHLFLFKVRHCLLDLHAAVDDLVMEVHVGARFVDQVDGLIGQKTVGDVPLGQQHRLAQDALGDLHAVERLIIMGDALEDLERILHVRLIDRDRLKTALQRGILFNVLAVFGEGRCADDLDLAAGKRRL